MHAGDEITITPTELVAGGAAIARVDGFPIFATNVYPGDVAVVRLLEVKKGFPLAWGEEGIRPPGFRPHRRAESVPPRDAVSGRQRMRRMRLDGASPRQAA